MIKMLVIKETGQKIKKTMITVNGSMQMDILKGNVKMIFGLKESLYSQKAEGKEITTKVNSAIKNTMVKVNTPL